MRETINGKVIGGNGTFTTYNDVVAFWEKQTSDNTGHKAVGLKNEKQKTISLQFVDPATGKRCARSCNEQFTERGILAAKDKAVKVAAALQTFTSAVEFWEWYEATIINLNVPARDLLSFCEIFAEIEKRFYNGYNRNTGRKRSRDLASDVNSFKGSYERYFKRFPNRDKYPEWSDFESALFNYPETPQGSKTFKDLLFVCKQIAEIANLKKVTEKLNKIDGKQTQFKKGQSIDIETFLSLHSKVENEATATNNQQHQQAKISWLWVSSMCVMYGLRPSEIAAAKNLTTPVTVVQTKDGKLEYLAEYDPSKGDAYYAISNPKNVDLALVLADFTYFGASIKTGERVCYPIPSKALQDRLKLREPSLPIIAGKLCNGFSETFSQWTERNFGISQAYAFRHLYNALGQQYGLNQETRALNMGHTVAANEGHYKQRNKRNNKVRKALLTVKNPLPYETAILELEHIGIDLNHSEVKLILRTIYQLD